MRQETERERELRAQAKAAQAKYELCRTAYRAMVDTFMASTTDEEARRRGVRLFNRELLPRVTAMRQEAERLHRAKSDARWGL